MTRTQMLSRALCALPLASALLFGTAQAFASSAPREAAAACIPRECNFYCGGAGGVCSYYGKCICR